VPKFDFVDLLAFTLLLAGIGLSGWGMYIAPPASIQELVSVTFGDWTPGLVVDGALLFILNRVIHSHERKRVISQVASLSNEFALDAVRRCRDEGWLQDGTLVNKSFIKARLASADLSDSKLAGVDFSFADLTGADLTYAELKGANLRGPTSLERTCDGLTCQPLTSIGRTCAMLSWTVWNYKACRRISPLWTAIMRIPPRFETPWWAASCRHNRSHW